MLKKHAPAEAGGRQRRSLPARNRFAQAGRPFVDLRAHRLAALRGVRAHVLWVRSARHAYSAEVATKAGSACGLFFDRLRKDMCMGLCPCEERTL